MHKTMSRGRGGGRSTSGGRRTGRSGRGRSGGRSRNNNSSQKGAQRTKLSDHMHNVGSAKHASDFIVANEHLINHIRKTCDHGGDTGSALEEMNHFDFQPCKPTLTASAETDAAKKKVEDRQFELEHTIEFKAYSNRTDTCAQNKIKSHSFLWGQCSKAMQHKVESKPKFASQIKNDPVELLKAIKEYAMA